MNNYSNSPVLITGAERSGSSIIAKIISLCGGFSGRINPMYENTEIKKLMNCYYTAMGLDSHNQYPLPNIDKLSIPIDWKDYILKVLSEQGYKGDLPWMYKSPKLCQIFPVWKQEFPDAKWIIVRRRTADIVYSCQHTAYMHSFSDEKIQRMINVKDDREGWIWWVRQHEYLFNSMLESKINYRVIWPERMVGGDYFQMKEIVEWLGLKWDDKIIPTIETMLWKSRINFNK